MTTEKTEKQTFTNAELFRWFVMMLAAIPLMVWVVHTSAPVAFSAGLTSAALLFAVYGFGLFMVSTRAYKYGIRIHSVLASEDSQVSALPEH